MLLVLFGSLNTLQLMSVDWNMIRWLLIHAEVMCVSKRILPHRDDV